MNKMRRWALALLVTSIVTGPARFSLAQSKSTDLLVHKDLKALVATAKTPADHAKLTRHFTRARCQI